MKNHYLTEFFLSKCKKQKKYFDEIKNLFSTTEEPIPFVDFKSNDNLTFMCLFGEKSFALSFFPNGSEQQFETKRIKVVPYKEIVNIEYESNKCKELLVIKTLLREFTLEAVSDNQKNQLKSIFTFLINKF